jgi:hypothetical protein
MPTAEGPAEHAAGLLAPRLDRVGLLLRERAVLDHLVELGVLGGRQRVAQLLRRDVQPLGGVVEDRLLGLRPVVLRHRGDRDAGAAREQPPGEGDGCDPSCTHARPFVRWHGPCDVDSATHV